MKMVTITGSRSAGSKVGKSAGEEMKKSVLELGGSNAMVVFEHANLENAVEKCMEARYENTGQRCDAGKRLMLQSSISDEFLKRFTEKVKNLRSGDPMDKDTFIGVMAKESLAENLEKQLQECLDKGAKLHIGGKRDGACFEPTIITGVTPEMPAFTEELFGPVMPVLTFQTEQEAIDLVNISDFGLGVSIFTKDVDHGEKLVAEFDEGGVFINELVKSDPALPFGGTKTSGYGREFSKHGIREFTNIKTVVINRS